MAVPFNRMHELTNCIVAGQFSAVVLACIAPSKAVKLQKTAHPLPFGRILRRPSPHIVFAAGCLAQSS